ncbi:MAG: aminopeptidase [Syntrophomonadaceae bacterium]|nr:aminopeptidase [Syntrophomonadaceae bacterium]
MAKKDTPAAKKEEAVKNNWSLLAGKELDAALAFSDGYIDFLNQGKTEREAARFIERAARQTGFKPLSELKSAAPGAKILLSHKGKAVALAVLGKNPLTAGMNLVASHIDAPRLDLKGNPLYEDEELALLKTHYYGGIKKYQWVTIPLALHGVVAKKDGSLVEITIGEKPGDPVFTISDLLPHLAQDQMAKTMAKGIEGEDLNVLFASRPLPKAEGPAVKAHALELLQREYGIGEEDFTSAELEIVPAFPARHVGFDRSMVGGYGQDDRVCAWTSLQAILEVKKPAKTALCVFVDKEEIGSAGNTGLQSLLLENLTAQLLRFTGSTDYYDVRQALTNSCALSADVNSAVDTNYPSVFEKRNNSFLNRGMALTKYTGSRGKSGASDANPEFIATLRKLFDDAGVRWQVGELGKVDIGGGGTVAQYIAYFGLEVVDCGVPVMSMHAPFEVTAKSDIYMTYKAYKAFLQNYTGNASRN